MSDADKTRGSDETLAADDRVGEPIEEPRESTDPREVVGSAGETLAEAERAQRGAVVDDDEDARYALYAQHSDGDSGSSAGTHDEPAPVVVAPVEVASVDAAPTTVEPVVEETVVDASLTPPPAAETVVAPVATASRPQPIFVQAPEPPMLKGNRGAAGAIGLVAAVVFAVLFFAASVGIEFVRNGSQVAPLGTWALDFARSLAFWVPVVVFFLAFWLLGALINRGRWGHWVIWGVVVAIISWGGFVAGALFAAPFWELTARQGVALAHEQLFQPGAFVALLLGREITVWFGAWVARRGRRVTALNEEAQVEYERTLEAGPQLYQS